MAVSNPISLDIDLEKQSVVLEGEENVRVSTFVDHENGKYFIEDYFDGVATMYDAMCSGEKQSGNGPCYGHIPEGEKVFTWISYTQAKETAFHFGSALIEKGFKPGQETYIGIYSQNRVEWALTDLACSSFSMVGVSLYDSLGVGSSKFIINTAELGVVVCDTLKKAESLLKLKEDNEVPSLKLLVVMEPPSEEKVKEAAEKGVELVTFQEMVEFGKEHEKELVGEEKVRVSTFLNHENGKYFIEDYFDGVATMYDAMCSGEEQSGNGPCYGHIPEGEKVFTRISYTQIKEYCEKVALPEGTSGAKKSKPEEKKEDKSEASSSSRPKTTRTGTERKAVKGGKSAKPESSIRHKMDAVCYLLLWVIILFTKFGWQTVYICRTVPDLRVSWPSFTKLFISALVIIGAQASASHYCAENQTAVLGEQGIIECNFPDNFYRVVWFDDISVNSSFVISCLAPCNVKNGPGFKSKDYDVFQSGSLSISRVTATHERSYEVFVYITPTYYEKIIVILKVIASPTGLLLSLNGNHIHQQHYQSINGKETLTCSVNAARPPVQVEWIEQTPNGEIVFEQVENIIEENENGSFNSSVSLYLTNSTMHKQMALLVCRATWMQQDWKREKKILLDNSGLESFNSEPKELLYFEINRRAEIRCEGSSGFVNLWKRVLPNKSVDLIGFSLDGATEVTTNSQSIRISPEGSLVFSSPDVDHEGTYVCINSYGMQNNVYVTDFTILIPPSPPYIQIEGCGDAMESCTLQGSDHHQLVCSVKGVRPAATLKWIASDTYEGKITFLNQNSVTEKHGKTSDVSFTTEYELISQHSACGDDVLIKCRLQGPVSHIMKSERTIILSQKACQVDQDEDGGVSILKIVLPVCFSLFFVLVACVIVLVAYKVLKRKTTATDSDESDPMNLSEGTQNSVA